MSFINEEAIHSTLDDAANTEPARQREALAKARSGERLTLSDVAALLSIRDADLREEVHAAAREVKRAIYGNRLVFFAPLYLTNHCVNNCLYCSFRRDNRALVRATLTQDEIRHEVEILLDQGHKRLLLVAGEHPTQSALDYIGESIETVYSVRRGNNNIRRVNINAAPMSTEDFRTLKSFGIGTYQCFQETYHRETYAHVHPSGPKHDYDWRVEVMDRAMEAGIDDVGIGVLFGLADYRFEILAMLEHVRHLEERFDGVGPHTISIPRLEPAMNAPLDSTNSPWTLADEDFKTAVAVLRLAIPYTGMILSTRERPELRRELFDYGISQISAGSRTDPGGYHRDTHEYAEQFQLGDHRPVREVVRDVLSLGYIPSFCTACYRSGRTGDRFMSLAKSANIGAICTPNALATFEEYLKDFGDEDMRRIAERIVEEEIARMPEPIGRKTREMIERTRRGETDVYI
ncbi:MAG: [FeFe] hydrogenase H-cluster radical SAM maturase HydG [Bacteroidota bacterium]|nr:[FeFe] hydrogenase H-cluster radical SAM maturase HydG [Bacteroidota bacterium]